MRPVSALHYYTARLCPCHDVNQHISQTFNYQLQPSMVHEVDFAGFEFFSTYTLCLLGDTVCFCTLAHKDNCLYIKRAISCHVCTTLKVLPMALLCDSGEFARQLTVDLVVLYPRSWLSLLVV